MLTNGTYGNGGRGGHRTTRSRSAGFGNTHNPLLREWNSPPRQGGLEMEEDEDCDDYSFRDHDLRSNKYRYARRMYPKKSKRLLLLVVVASAIITAVIALSKSSRKGHLPDLDTDSKEASLENVGVDLISPVQGSMLVDSDAAVEDAFVGEDEFRDGTERENAAKLHQNIAISEDPPREGAEITEEEKLVEPHQNSIDGLSSVQGYKAGASDVAGEHVFVVEEQPEGGEESMEKEAAESQQSVDTASSSFAQEDKPSAVKDVAVAEEELNQRTDSTEEGNKTEAQKSVGINAASLAKEDEPGDDVEIEGLPAVEEDRNMATESTEEKEEETLKEEDVREEGNAVLTGAGLEAITRHILCCSSSISSSSNALDANSNATSDPVATEYAHAGAHHPRWYRRSNGWHGRTYQEALTFCAEQPAAGEDTGSRMRLCPYAVYCPAGPRFPPLGGLPMEENEEGGRTTAYSSRAPISDRPNGWVQVGSLHVCVQYDIFEEEDGSQVKKEVNSR